MHGKFTHEDLIKHLYSETNREETASIEQAINQDPELKSEMQQLREAKIAIERGDDDRPGRTVLEKIKAYSLEKSLQETH